MNVEELSEWVEAEISKHGRHIHKLASLPWEEYADRYGELVAHTAKIQILTQIRKKLKETD